MSELPNGWAPIRLKDVCRLLNGREYKQDELLDKGKYQVLRVGNFFTNQVWLYSDLELDAKKYCEYGDLLYAWSASIGPKIWNGEKAIYHYHIWKTCIERQAVEKRYLYYWFEWDKENIKKERGTGSLMIHVAKGDMEVRPMLLPPLPEQRRIITKLDTLSAHSARAQQELRNVPALIERYKRTILGKAFSGDLTANWRAERSAIRTWTSECIGQIAEVVTGSTLQTVRRADYSEGTVPFFRPSDLDAGFRLSKPREALPEAIAKEAKLVPAGSTLVTCIGATIAKAGFVRVRCCTNQQIKALVPDQSRVYPEWLYWCVISPQFQRSIVANASATTLPIINKGRFERLPLSLPPLTEQKEIARRVEIALQHIDNIAAEYIRAAHLLPKLDQAILDKAFRGKLVPQDTSDEPASVLLERMRFARTSPTQRRRLASPQSGAPTNWRPPR